MDEQVLQHSLGIFFNLGERRFKCKIKGRVINNKRVVKILIPESNKWMKERERDIIPSVYHILELPSSLIEIDPIANMCSPYSIPTVVDSD